MDRTWFPSSGERNSFLRHGAAPHSHKRGSSPRYKTKTTAIELGLVATMILIVAASIIW